MFPLKKKKEKKKGQLDRQRKGRNRVKVGSFRA